MGLAGGTDDQSKRDAYDTLYTVLTTLTRAVAPLLPFVAEEIHTSLTDADSVHLADWPDPEDLPADPDLVERMDWAREVVSVALRLRETNAPAPASRSPASPLPASRPATTTSSPRAGAGRGRGQREGGPAHRRCRGVRDVRAQAQRPARAAMGADTQQVMAAARAGEWQRADDGRVTVAGHTLELDEFEPAPSRRTVWSPVRCGQGRGW